MKDRLDSAQAHDKTTMGKGNIIHKVMDMRNSGVAGQEQVLRFVQCFGGTREDNRKLIYDQHVWGT